MFFWGGEEEGVKGGGGRGTQVLGQAYFHPAFILHPLLYLPPPPPTHSPSSLNLWDDEIGVQGLGGRQGRERERPFACWRHPFDCGLFAANTRSTSGKLLEWIKTLNLIPFSSRTTWPVALGWSERWGFSFKGQEERTESFLILSSYGLRDRINKYV